MIIGRLNVPTTRSALHPTSITLSLEDTVVVAMPLSLYRKALRNQDAQYMTLLYSHQSGVDGIYRLRVTFDTCRILTETASRPSDSDACRQPEMPSTPS